MDDIGYFNLQQKDSIESFIFHHKEAHIKLVSFAATVKFSEAWLAYVFITRQIDQARYRKDLCRIKR